MKPILTLIQKRTRLAKRSLAVRGLVEAVTWSFIAKSEAELFGGGARLALANPIASDLSDMRPSLLPGLLKAAQRNADRGFGDVALFEVGQTFASDEPEKARASRRPPCVAALARTEGVGRHWDGGAQNVDSFDAKADVMALLATLGIPAGGLQGVPGGPAWFHPGRSATLQFGPRTWSAPSARSANVLKALDLKGPLVAFELNLDALPPPKAKPTKMKPKLVLSDFQPITRDFAFVVGRQVQAGDIVKAAQPSGSWLSASTCSTSTRAPASTRTRSPSPSP